MKKVQIVIPVLSLTFPENVTCLLIEQELLLKEGYEIEIVHHMHESLISRGRCVIAHKFLESSNDYLMCIDSDITFEPGAVLKLLKHDKLLVGANYRHKTEIAERWAGIPENRYDPLVKSSFVPTGFMLVKREAFEQILKCKKKDPKFNLDWFHTSEFIKIWGFYIPFIEKMDKDQVYLSEDWAFTRRLEDAGITCYMDNTIELGHIGKKVY